MKADILASETQFAGSTEQVFWCAQFAVKVVSDVQEIETRAAQRLSLPYRDDGSRVVAIENFLYWYRKVTSQVVGKR